VRQKISKSTVNKLQPGMILTDSNPVGFVARRLNSGAVTYGFRYRDKQTGKQRWIGLGLHGDLTPDQARKKALRTAGAVRDGDKPVSAAVVAATRRQSGSGTVDELLDDFVTRYVRKLRSADEIERSFTVYVRPRLGQRSIYDLKRSDIVGLLDAIEDSGAPVMADRVLAHLRKAFNWKATRDDEFNSPIVKGMARTKPKERARTRALDDQEIVDLWTALDELDGKVPACFPAFTRTLLLTAQRLRMVSDMTWNEIADHDWTIAASRNKGKVDHLIPLTDAALALLGPRKKSGYVFSSDGGTTAFSGFSKAKEALDRKLAEVRKRNDRKPMAHWTFHDLRRSARTLMSRAGVPIDHAERVLGHVIPGVRGTYDVHQYQAEKKDALEKLDALVQRILRPGGKVVRFPKRARRVRGAA
jgi:integrase